MLFNSAEFLFLFLPVTWLGFYLLGARPRIALAWLALASLFFYGWWNPVYLLLIVGSIAVNYLIGRRLAAHPSRLVLSLGIAANLACIGYYKYAGFLAANLEHFTGAALGLGQIALPLAISFFTFQQIAYLVDAWRGEAHAGDFLGYVLFVTFFPQLIAGPIVHHGETMPQFAKRRTFRIDPDSLAQGLAIFSIGLFKKVVLGDGIAAYATPLFDAAQAGYQPTLFEAWGGALAYTFQLYFDFSGYSDMAIGLARMFNIRLPINFDSPYKAVNIIDFWRRWHITLSRFLRDYLYIPLGGSRRGPARRYANLLTAMLLGGLWHGAGWTFVAWGGLHGAYLAINHAWHALRARLGHDLSKSTRLGRLLALGVTFVAVVVAWVFFRAESFTAAGHILAGMAGTNGIALPDFYQGLVGPLGPVVQEAGWRFEPAETLMLQTEQIILLALLATMAFLLPNSQRWVGRAFEAPDAAVAARLRPRVVPSWLPAGARGAALGLLLCYCAQTILAGAPSEFLYFRF